MNWITLTRLEQIEHIRQASYSKPQVIFKHSTRCSISAMAKNRLDKATIPDEIEFHFLDLIQYRAVSNEIAAGFGIEHESPQILLIRDGVCVFDASHTAISMNVLREALQ